jgi:geranylgeranyl diphosphate synthase, type II
MDIKAYLEEKRGFIDSYLKSYFETPSLPLVLHESMQYSLLSGGKRIRPILALASYEACGGDAKAILPQAAALELIHTYSLIHDDLPAMDNDDLRRGQPTNHKVFGEAMAILAGDALLTEAFFMMTGVNPPFPPFTKGGNTEKVTKGWGIKMTNLSNQKSKAGFSLNTKAISPISRSALLRAIRDVALAAGAHGMVGGQAQDILAENSEPNKETLNFIHLHKTAALIAASVRIGPILANSGTKKLRALTHYGDNIGLAFQIVDDILDVEGTTVELGKPVGSDSRKNKLTYPSLYGIEVARHKADEYMAAAIRALSEFSAESDPLREIAHYLVTRRN